MKKRQTRNKLSFWNKPFFRVLGLLIILFSILLIIEKNKNKEVLTNGIENIAIITGYSENRFIDNAISQQRFLTHLIEFEYQFNGIKYTKTLELKDKEFKNKIGRKINTGDTIKIKHSGKNQGNVVID